MRERSDPARPAAVALSSDHERLFWSAEQTVYLLFSVCVLCCCGAGGGRARDAVLFGCVRRRLRRAANRRAAGARRASDNDATEWQTNGS